MHKPVMFSLLTALIFAALQDGSANESTSANTQRHVIVVGGGLAGLSAAAEAAARGARVTLVEKEAKVGGNSAKATSGMNGVNTRAQRLYDVHDTVDAFRSDTERAGRGMCDSQLVQTLAEHSQSAVEFVESMGVDLSVLSQLGGHSSKRTHREPNTPEGRPRPIGWDIVSALRKHVEGLGDQVQTLVGAQVSSLVTDASEAVIGIEYRFDQDASARRLEADAVVLATGGYSMDKEGFMKQYAPQLAFLPSTNGWWAKGDGVRLGTQIGGKAIHMDKVQVHPTGFVDPANPEAPVKFLAPEALRGSGGILLNLAGVRFVDELAPRDTVTGAFYKYAHPEIPSVNLLEDYDKSSLHLAEPRESVAVLVLNDAAVARFGKAAFGFYHVVKKFFVKVEGVSGLSQLIQQQPGGKHCTDAIVENTLRIYRQRAADGSPDMFGKTVYPDKFEAALDASTAFYAALVTPSIHYTMGGLAIDTNAQVLKEAGGHILGLFAAGEVSGGVHGANRLGGNSLLECVVFGRIAGRNAASGTAKAHDEL